MAIEIKGLEAIKKMRAVGALAAAQLEMIGEIIKPGVSTGELDRICHDFTINEQEAIPAPLNYKGFPKSICTSVNHVVCHGIPSDDKILNDGDIVNVDVTLIKDGYQETLAKLSLLADQVSAKRLTQISHECLLGIQAVKPGDTSRTSAMSSSPRRRNRFSVVREYCGHGIGTVFHDDPQVLVMTAGNWPRNAARHDFTIEPMINAVKPP